VPPATSTALRYYTSGNQLWVLDQVLSIVMLAVILFSGVSARLRALAQRIGRNWFFTIVVYFALFTIVTFVITLPLTYYEEFVRQHDYGLSNQTLQKWWTDSLTTLAVTCVAGGLFLWVPYLLLRKSPRRWWLYTAAAAIPFIVVANLVAPIWIAPLFNRFEPMHDKALEARILHHQNAYMALETLTFGGSVVVYGFLLGITTQTTLNLRLPAIAWWGISFLIVVAFIRCFGHYLIIRRFADYISKIEGDTYLYGQIEGFETHHKKSPIGPTPILILHCVLWLLLVAVSLYLSTCKTFSIGMCVFFGSVNYLSPY
jgi:hypothetical protein